MVDSWPFLHLNLLSPDLSSEQLSLNATNLQDVALNSSELNRQLEAWTNIDFNFDIDPVSDPRPSKPSLAFSSCDSLESVAGSTGSYDQLFDYPADNSYLRQPSSSPAYVVPTNPTSLQHVCDLSVPSPELTCGTQPASNLLPTALRYSELGRNESLKSSSDCQRHLSIPAQLGTFDSTPTPQNTLLKPDLPALDDDEANKIAIEDDKRRRNTLASARFRMKKKMKEQEIERTAQEMKERVNELEKQVETLTQENKWLRGLIVEQAATKAAINSDRKIEIAEPAHALTLPTKRSAPEEEPPSIPSARTTKVARKLSSNSKRTKVDE